MGEYRSGDASTDNDPSPVTDCGCGNALQTVSEQPSSGTGEGETECGAGMDAWEEADPGEEVAGEVPVHPAMRVSSIQIAGRRERDNSIPLQSMPALIKPAPAMNQPGVTDKTQCNTGF